MRSQEFKELLDRYSRGEATPEEEELISTWYDNIKADIDNNKPYDDELEHRLWSRIRPKSPQLANQNNFFFKIAASIALVITAALTIYFISGKELGDNTILSIVTHEAGEFLIFSNSSTAKKVVELPDGSMVTLEMNSQISIQKGTDGKTRSVYLTGGAFFDVKRDTLRPFIVYSKEITTKVLGTSFHIKAYDASKEITVAVKTGKVSVFTKEETESDSKIHEVILTPNQRMVYNRGEKKVLKEIVDNPDTILPQTTLFKMDYDDSPVTQIFEVLEANYGIDIQYDDEALKGCVLTTSMTDEGFYERIDIICKAINAEYKTENAVVFIKSRGCN
jgi:hypothetical protein